MAILKNPDDLSSIERDNSEDDTLRLRPSDFGGSRQNSDSEHRDSEPSESRDENRYEGQTGAMSGRGSDHEH